MQLAWGHVAVIAGNGQLQRGEHTKAPGTKVHLARLGAVQCCPHL